MHIGIDGRFVQGHNTGVTNYLLNLLRSISRLDRRNTYTVFLSDPNYIDRIPQGENFNVEVKVVNALIWKNIWLPSRVKKLKLDLMHFPAYTGSFVNIGKNVVTVHDLIHKVNPEWFSRKELALLEFPVSLAIKKATRIIAVSESTKRDIMRYYNVSENRITVTLEASDASFRPIDDQDAIAEFKKKYGIKGDFILNVGVLFKRRNIPRLLEAFSLLRQGSDVDCKLVIAGPGKVYFNLEEEMARHGLTGKEVVYLGYVAQEDMPLLYNAALFFIYPSLYEGFGLPVLEAMACGKPAITSNVSSLPEVLGEAGLLVDPYSVEELYGAMRRLMMDRPLREKFGQAAVLRSKIFNWDKMAEQTKGVYEEVVNE